MEDVVGREDHLLFLNGDRRLIRGVAWHAHQLESVVANVQGHRVPEGNYRSIGPVLFQQGGFRNGRAETNTEGEGQQGGHAALAGKLLGQALAQGRESAFQPLDELDRTGDHRDYPDDNVAQVGDGLLQGTYLEEDDNGGDGGKVPQRIADPVGVLTKDRVRASS